MPYDLKSLSAGYIAAVAAIAAPLFVVIAGGTQNNWKMVMIGSVVLCIVIFGVLVSYFLSSIQHRSQIADDIPYVEAELSRENEV